MSYGDICWENNATEKVILIFEFTAPSKNEIVFTQ